MDSAAPTQIADCYALIVRKANLYSPGSVEECLLDYNPTMVLAHHDDQPMGFYSYSFYQAHTPFRRNYLCEH